MDTTTTNRKPRKARTMRLDCCSDDVCTSGSRNNYFPGKRLTPDSFRAEQNYFIDRRHLLNRAMYGWGVVYGYRTAMAERDKTCPGAELGRMEICEGLALDKCGRELVQTGSIVLTLENVLLLDWNGLLIRSQSHDTKDRFSQLKVDANTYWLLSVHYAEQNIDSVTLKDACSCERKEWNQVCETVRYSLRPVTRSDCCVEQPCGLNCCCATSPCCGESDDPKREKLEKELEKARDEYTRLSADGKDKEGIRLAYEHVQDLTGQLSHMAGGQKDHGRGGCRCICDHLTKLEIGCDCGTLCQVDSCARADLSNGVGLACLKLEDDGCGGWRFSAIYDDCGPRRLVKRNDLLFDLIRGCDVTRISEIGWKDWHRKKTPIDFDAFAEALGFDENNQSEPEYVTKLFWIRFSCPVREETLCSDCFAMTIMATETEGGWWQVFRVPIVGVETKREKDDPPGHVSYAAIVVNGGWLIDAVCGRYSIFKAGQTRVEFEVRGDFIVDCNGQTVDANARGLSSSPSGSDGPGDSFLSTFTVDRRDPGDSTYKPKPYAQHAEGGKS